MVDVTLMSHKMTLIKRFTGRFSSYAQAVLPRNAAEFPQFQEAFKRQDGQEHRDGLFDI